MYEVTILEADVIEVDLLLTPFAHEILDSHSFPSLFRGFGSLRFVCLHNTPCSDS